MSFIKILSNLFSNKNQKYKYFENKIGYRFLNSNYLTEALTHRSTSNQKGFNYERLEFIGDAIIDLTVSIWLFNKYSKSDEGILTKNRAALVNKNFLSMLGHKLNIIDLIIVDAGVNLNDTKVSDNISADAYEALAGAIYLDGGYKNASKFIKNTLCIYENMTIEDTNYKGQLIEYCHKNELSNPQFEILQSHGPDHNKTFIVSVEIANMNQTWEGMGLTKKFAEQQGAKNALNYLLSI